MKSVNNFNKSSEGKEENKRKLDSKGYNPRRKNSNDSEFTPD